MQKWEEEYFQTDKWKWELISG